MERTIQILWPSFIVAGIMDILMFAFFDPMEIMYQGSALFESRLAAYSAVFFIFWLFGASSSILTCYFQCSVSQSKRFCKIPASQSNHSKT
jgi:hypothetical protein